MFVAVAIQAAYLVNAQRTVQFRGQLAPKAHSVRMCIVYAQFAEHAGPIHVVRSVLRQDSQPRRPEPVRTFSDLSANSPDIQLPPLPSAASPLCMAPPGDPNSPIRARQGAQLFDCFYRPLTQAIW